MKPERAVMCGTGEIVGAAGCKLFVALRQIPPSPCAFMRRGDAQKVGYSRHALLFLFWVKFYKYILVYYGICCDVMTKKCELRPSAHAKTKMIVWGFNKENIIEAILKGAKRIEQNKIVVTYGGFEVVYKQYPCNYFIITVYWKVRRGGV